MKYADIKALPQQELLHKIREETSLLNKLKFAHSVAPIENPMKIRHSRRFIARLKTELSARANTSN